MAKDKRVEVLFDPKDYRLLEDAAHREGKSVGHMIREAVAKYVVQPTQDERQRALEWVFSQDLGPPGSPEEIKEDILRDMDEGLAESLEAD
jgi:hypothetical protein